MANYSPMILLFFLLTYLGKPARLTDYDPPAIFIFGDSSADVGTNNYIEDCSFKSNHTQYGVDYDEGVATGRWSNGYNIADYISKLFGFERSPEPFLAYNPRSEIPCEMYSGVNFASAGSGLLNTTGEKVDVVPVPEQVGQFSRIRDDLIAEMGQEKADSLISRSIFIVSVGGNDILTTFFMGISMSEMSFILPYMEAYSDIIKELHSLGARKFGIVSIFPMGCVPMIRVTNKTGGCVTETNQLSKDFHKRLKELLISLEKELKDFKYSLGNTYRILMRIINDSDNPDTACCGIGKLNAEYFCNETSYMCKNRDKYVFWDPVHPTDAASEAVAEELFCNEETYPINFGQLAANTSSMMYFVIKQIVWALCVIVILSKVYVLWG